MFRSRLAYKFLFVFVIFALASIVPLSVIFYYDSAHMVESMERIELLMPEQKAVQEAFISRMFDTLVSFSFYMFVLAFIVSLFLAHKFLVPVRELFRGAMALKEGRLDIKLDVKTEDELGEVTKAFNDMVQTLREKTTELQRKNTYIESMLDPLWVVDMDNNIIDINPAFTRLFGYSRGEVIGASIFDFLDEENEKIMRRQLVKRDEGLSSSYAISIISKEEGLIPVLMSGAPIIEKGEVVARLGIMKDFRNEIALRDALKEEKEHSEAIMDSLVDALLVINNEMRIITANKAAVLMAGKDIVGSFCHEVFHKRPDSCFMHGLDCPTKIVFETGKSYKTIHEHFESGDRQVFHEITAYPVKSSSGEVINVVELIRDITEKKRYEDELTQRNKELTTLNSIAKILSHSLWAEDIFINVLSKITDMIGLEGGGIYFIDEAGRELLCKHQRGISEDFMRTARRLKVGEDIPGRVAVTGQGIFISDVSKDSRIEKSIFKHSGVKAFASIPIKGKERLLGVFYIFGFKPHEFTVEDERILSSIGEMMGMAFENIRLYERMKELYEQHKKRKLEEQKNLITLSSLLTSSLDIERVLDSSSEAIRQTLRADLVWILGLDDMGNLYIASSTDGSAKGETLYSRDTSSIERYALEKRKPVVFSEIKTEPRFYLASNLEGYNTACSIPLIVAEKTLGALSLYYRGFSAPSEEDVLFLQTISSMLAVTIERARLYQMVMLEKEMADTILQSITDGIITLDTRGRVISINRAAREMIGPVYEKGFVGVQVCDLFLYRAENTELRWLIGECLEEALSGRVSFQEAELYTRGGRVIPLEVNSSPVRDREGNLAGVVYVLRDKSREKEIEMLKTDFVKAVSHEFRTPLSAIVGMAEMLLDGEVEKEKEKDYLRTVLEEGRRLSEMVSDVLDVARIESGKEVFRADEVDFNQVLASVRDALQSPARAKDITLSTLTEGEIRGYIGDQEKLKHAIINLVENSLIYSDRGKKVNLSVKGFADKIIISVEDEGWGIPEKDIPHLGEKFFRGIHASRTKGTGLGFALVKRIIDMHGGSISVKSTLGVGTKVMVELPKGKQKEERL